MKSKIRVELDFDNKPYIRIVDYGHPYYNDQNLVDRLLSSMMKDISHFEVKCVGGGSSDTEGGYTEYELRPVKIKDTPKNVLETREALLRWESQGLQIKLGRMLVTEDNQPIFYENGELKKYYLG